MLAKKYMIATASRYMGRKARASHCVYIDRKKKECDLQACMLHGICFKAHNFVLQ